MNKLYLYKKYLLFLMLHSTIFNVNGAWITNAKEPGRLCDNLLGYVKTKYFSKQYAIPFVLNPFTHSNKFVFDDIEPKKRANYQSVMIENFNQIDTKKMQNVCFITGYACDFGDWIPSQAINTWHELVSDKQFIDEMRDLITLKDNTHVIYPPSDILSVAVHVRKPSGPDLPLIARQLYDMSDLKCKLDNVQTRSKLGKKYIDGGFDFKFPPDQYYIDQIRYIADRFSDQKIYIYIFTDYSNPKVLKDKFEKIINSSDLVFDCRSSIHFVVEDMISLKNFDCLIRSGSNFAQMGELLGNHQLIISPKELNWYLDTNDHYCLVVSDVVIKDNQQKGRS